MKRRISILFSLAIASGLFALGRSPEEMGAFVRSELCRIVENTPSDNDSNGDSLANYHDIEPEVWSAFFGPSAYKGWELNERKAAFDWYLNSICTNDTKRIDGEELAMFRVALGQCRRSSYTNAVPALKELVKNPYGVDKSDALHIIIACSTVSDVLTDYIENVMTNKSAYRLEDRGEACRRYAAKVRLLESGAVDQTHVKSRAAAMFYRNRLIDVAGAYSIDRLFVDQYPGYATSSNRFEYINFVLAHPFYRTRPYFIAITNQLLSAGQPLRQLNIGD